MAFRIRNNYEADVGLTYLNYNKTQISKLQQQLATGLRIVRAADDAADLFIADYLKHTYVGLQRGTLNAQYGLAAARVADDALGKIYDILVKIKDKIVAAANARTKDERIQIQSQINEYVRNINEIVKQTEFDGRHFLAGDTFTVQFGSHANQYLIFNGTADNATNGAYIKADAGATGSTKATIEISKQVKEFEAINASVPGATTNAEVYTVNLVSAGGTGGTGSASSGGSTSTEASFDIIVASDYSNIQKSLDNIEKLMTAVDRLRGYYGNIENKLQNIIENNQMMTDNLKEGESKVRNVDYASAMAEFTKMQTIMQANIAAIAQANQIPALVQQLLR
jgi:flagellin